MKFNPEIANVLPNGAVIIQRKQLGNSWVWLCEYKRRKHYVVWCSSKTEPAKVYGGTYFGTFMDAFIKYRYEIRRKSKLCL